MTGTLSLTLVPHDAEAYFSKIREFVADGARDLRIAPWGDLAASLVTRIAEAGLPCRLDVEDWPGELPQGCERLPADAEPDVFVRLETDGELLARSLMDLVDLPEGRVLAARTDRYGLALPLFLISIPKSGTHMLMDLIRRLGYVDGLVHDGTVRPGSWYYVEYSNSHTRAPDFFVDTVRRSPFGNRQHPFATSPALFLYRHPYDIVVSEANYYHRRGKTAFAGYLRHLEFEERLLRLVDDPWLLGSLRDRVGAFAAWLDFGNVIPLSFEEMIGAAGGSDPRLQRQALWSLLLKLQVEGDVDRLAGGIFNPESPTFTKGTIGRHRELLIDAAWEALERLDRDYLSAFGYAGNRDGPLVSSRIEEFRHRPLLLDVPVAESEPVMVETDFLGWNLVRLGSRFYGFSVTDGPRDLRGLSEQELAQHPSAASVSSLRHEIVAHISRNSTVQTLKQSFGEPVDGYRGYDIYHAFGHWFGIRTNPDTGAEEVVITRFRLGLNRRLRAAYREP